MAERKIVKHGTKPDTRLFYQRKTRSIAPKSLAAFDRDRALFNCVNGTFNLADMALRDHCAEDYITKISRVRYDAAEYCERCERFIGREFKTHVKP